MNRLFRVPIVAVGFALALGLSASPSARMGPSVVMIYGGSLKSPVVLRLRTVADLGTYADFWGGRFQVVKPAHLIERPYFNVAMFWGANLLDADQADLKAENAHQHGRLHVATRDTRAALLSTAFMQLDRTGLPLTRPVPVDVGDFDHATWLTDDDLNLADKFGVPLRAR